MFCVTPPSQSPPLSRSSEVRLLHRYIKTWWTYFLLSSVRSGENCNGQTCHEMYNYADFYSQRFFFTQWFVIMHSLSHDTTTKLTVWGNVFSIMVSLLYYDRLWQCQSWPFWAPWINHMPVHFFFFFFFNVTASYKWLFCFHLHLLKVSEILFFFFKTLDLINCCSTKAYIPLQCSAVLQPGLRSVHMVGRSRLCQ